MPKVIFPRARRQARASAESNPAPPAVAPPLEPYEGYRRFILTLNVVEPEARDKFHSLSRPDSFYEIRPNREAGQRGAYSVEMTYEEYQQALEDAQNIAVNLIAVDPNRTLTSHGGLSSPGSAAMTYLGGSAIEDTMGGGAGVDVGVIDEAISASFVSAAIPGRLKASRDAYDETKHHGNSMSGLAVPPQAQLVHADHGGIEDGAISAVFWMVDEIGVDIINMSFGFPGTGSTAFKDALEHARSNNVLLFSSHGNSGDNTTYGPGQDFQEFPGNHPAVKAITNYRPSTNSINFTSNYGSGTWAAAPGSEVNVYGAGGVLEYSDDEGTSGASALAVRVAADVLGMGKSPQDAEKYMVSTAYRTGASQAYEGIGLLQLEAESGEIPELEGTEDTGHGPGMGPPETEADHIIDPNTGEIIDPGCEGGGGAGS